MLGRVIDDDFTRMLDRMDEARRQLDQMEEKLDEAESKLGEAESKLGEAESKLGEAESKLDEVEGRTAAILCAAEYLTEKGRSDQIIRLYHEPSYLEEVLEEIENQEKG